MKESVAFRTAALIQGGYVQVDDTIQCPLCDERFVLLLDSKRDSDSEAATGKQKEKTISFFREMIQQDHINDHPHWQFRMTAPKYIANSSDASF